MSKATKRIKEGYHKVKLVPEGTEARISIDDDGEYPIVDTSNGEVFEGVFYRDAYIACIHSPKWLTTSFGSRSNSKLKRFKLLD